MSEEQKYKFYIPPPEEGYYWITASYKIAVNKKPCWFHRTMCRLVLGFKWEDR